jgi:starch phosphorylase
MVRAATPPHPKRSKTPVSSQQCEHRARSTKFALSSQSIANGDLVVSAQPELAVSVDERTSFSKEALKSAFLDNLFYVQGKFPALATQTDYYMALAYTVRDRMLQRWISTAAAYTRQGSRTVCYLSAEFLMGPHLGNNLINLGIYDQVKQAIT